MSFLDQIKADIEQITGDADGMTKSLFLQAPTGETATITGLHTKHHLSTDTDGNNVNAKNAHISFSEKYLTDLNYPVRDILGRVTLKGHKVTVSDSTGNNSVYMIREWYPDETIGLIVCILGDFT